MSVYQRVCLTTVQHMFSSSYSIGRSCLSPSQQKHVKTKDTRGLMPILYHPFYGSRENCSPSKWSKGGYGFVCVYLYMNIYIYSYIYMYTVYTCHRYPAKCKANSCTLDSLDTHCMLWFGIEKLISKEGWQYLPQRLLGNVSHEVFSSIHDVKERETTSWI